ncbi:MAG: sugar transferase [Fusobacterium gastrosuis]|uniref:sugar transferase n=1 Tax=Fusobacterium gastrosuis TaxID=1755100 RepID=UPI002A9B4F3C|nr:sugar transferase [Fusobacterium gastrosuis]
MLKRTFDLFFSLFGIIFFFPIFLLISILIKLDSKGEIIFKQTRVTKDGKEFKIYKFRTMMKETEGNKQITVGKDNRITKVGSFLRKTKLDELPQLFNIIKGEMSFVGPRPEVPKYVAYYTDEQKEILKVRAGITDYASIYFSNESEILGQQNDPEKYYIEEIMPHKIKLNKKYINNMGIITDIKIIILTILKIVGVELKEE